MNSDELRELAEALDPSGKVLTHPGESTLLRAADYLRQCAKQRPSAWMHPDGRVVPAARALGLSSLRSFTIPLYAAPAAPQAEAKREPRVKPTHEAADAFWRYWHENGETHKHGYYESTWGAINAALACGLEQAEPQEK